MYRRAGFSPLGPAFVPAGFSATAELSAAPKPSFWHSSQSALKFWRLRLGSVDELVQESVNELVLPQPARMRPHPSRTITDFMSSSKAATAKPNRASLYA